ncbi:MAG: hypothetical protein GX456_02085 [Verrucomicrobia bacterium]|nr:hypothetical protein [Verrucomicrobiota bacterium]
MKHAGWEFLRTLRQPPIGTKGNFQAMPQSGGKTQTTSLSLYGGSCFDLRERQAACAEALRLAG